ncbi:MAG: hypothetical protein IJ165_03085, partial [Proteobacteria bacterium]|nr:hypothetical protein [Pseudomonadota bacterium]
VVGKEFVVMAGLPTVVGKEFVVIAGLPTVVSKEFVVMAGLPTVVGKEFVVLVSLSTVVGKEFGYVQWLWIEQITGNPSGGCSVLPLHMSYPSGWHRVPEAASRMRRKGRRIGERAGRMPGGHRPA